MGAFRSVPFTPNLRRLSVVGGQTKRTARWLLDKAVTINEGNDAVVTRVSDHLNESNTVLEQ